MIRELTQNLDIISALENEPNDEGGLSAPELKAKFDESGNTIREYINGTLIPDVYDTLSDGISAAEIASGNMPNGGTAGQMLVKKSDADYDIGFADLPASADTLSSKRAIQTNLASAEAAGFDGSADILPGVTGVLQPSNGGTGAKSAEGAALALGRGYGTSVTASATAAKVAELPGFVRSTGAVVGVKFTYANSANMPTLNVNDTGAAYIIDYRTNTNPLITILMVAGTHFFMFDGTYWQLLNPYADVGAPVTGAYTGNGTASRVISIGFMPQAVFIWKAVQSSYTGQNGLAVFGYPAYTNSISYPVITIVSGGFTVYYVSTGNANTSQWTNASNDVYNYLAWR